MSVRIFGVNLFWEEGKFLCIDNWNCFLNSSFFFISVCEEFFLFHNSNIDQFKIFIFFYPLLMFY